MVFLTKPGMTDGSGEQRELAVAAAAFRPPRFACASSPASEMLCHLAQGLQIRLEAGSSCGKGDAVKALY